MRPFDIGFAYRTLCEGGITDEGGGGETDCLLEHLHDKVVGDGVVVVVVLKYEAEGAAGHVEGHVGA